MNAPLLGRPAAAGPIEIAEGWFVALGADYLGNVPADQLGTKGARGWRVAHEGGVLRVFVGPDFPFSRPEVHIEGRIGHFRRPNAEPHVEPNGKLCLRPVETPGDPVQSVKTALAHAIRLLRENESGQHIEDFQEDFGLYWRHWKTAATPTALVLPHPSFESRFGYSVERGARLYVFPTKCSCSKYLDNLMSQHVGRPRRMAFIGIHPLPAPNRYPGDGRELRELVQARSPDGLPFLEALTTSSAAVADVVLFGRAPSGREHHVALRLAPSAPLAAVAKRTRRLIPRGDGSLASICSALEVRRLNTERLDAAKSRLPHPDRSTLASKRVVVVGVGALGAGVAKMLAQAGVGDLIFVDPDDLGWENIARHEFGANAVGLPKAMLLAQRLRRMLPEIARVEGHKASYDEFAGKTPELALGADITVSCTGSLGADLAVEATLANAGKGVAVYGWMETNALAAHAVYIGRTGPRFADGFDADGAFRMRAVKGGRPPPPECGGSTSPFGAVELAQTQSLVARLCVDVLRGKAECPTWRTWLADKMALEEVDASWRPSWLRERGEPSEWGGIVSGAWAFP